MRWRPIAGFEGYEISSDGRVLSRKRRVPAILVAQPNCRNGYESVILTKRTGKKKNRMYIHRLVAETFLGPAPDGCEVLHINGNRRDNNLTNLRWGTRAENMQDCLDHGTNFNVNKQFCKSGHEFDEINTIHYIVPSTGRGRRKCRQCVARWNSELTLRMKNARGGG